MRNGILGGLVFIFLVSATLTNLKPMDLIRDTYKKALKESDSVKELKFLTKDKSDAHSIAFYAMALAFEARETNWVPAKLSLANDAYAKLNKAVKANPKNFEIRYLRFSFSCEVPSMLGLNDHLAEDKVFLLDHAEKGEYLADIMKKYFEKSSCMSESEKHIINTRL